MTTGSDAPRGMRAEAAHDTQPTTDDEPTSVADAQWLAELRARARRADRPLRDELADETPDSAAHADDEVTAPAASRTIDEVREVVAERRAHREAASPPAAPASDEVMPKTGETSERWTPPRRLATVTHEHGAPSFAPDERRRPRWLIPALAGITAATLLVLVVLLTGDEAEAPPPDEPGTTAPSDPEGTP